MKFTPLSNFNRLLNRGQFGKLKSILEYKLTLEGLPKPISVHAARTNQTCPECGHWSPKNRGKTALIDGFEMECFECQGCGYKDDADLNAARVIAMKGRWFETKIKGKLKRGQPLPDALFFGNYLKEAATTRNG